MTRPTLLFTRPTDELARGHEAASAAGFHLLAAPLLEVEELSFTIPEGSFDALLFTSPRAPSIVARQAPQLRALPCCAVGPRTAEAAIAAGFEVVLTGKTDGVEIVESASAHGFRHLLQPGGEDRIAIPVPAGVTLTSIAVYRAKAATRLADEVAAALADGEIFATMLFSPRTARIFASLLQLHGVSREKLRLVALSANVATAAGADWMEIATATLPNLEDALVAAGKMWQKRQHG